MLTDPQRQNRLSASGVRDCGLPVRVASAVTGNVCPVPRAAMSHAVSGDRRVEPVTEEDF